MMPRRALYLCSPDPVRILRDGSCLRVQQRYRADRYYDISRLYIVISHRKVQWDPDALMLCAENRISVHFISGHGQVIARLSAPDEYTADTLQQKLDDYLVLPDSAQRFRRWYSVQSYYASEHVAQRFGIGHARLLHIGVEEYMRGKLKGMLGKCNYQGFRTRLQGAVQAHLKTQLANHGIDTDCVLISLLHERLDSAFARLSLLYLYPDMITWLRHISRDVHGSKPSKARVIRLQAMVFHYDHSEQIMQKFDMHMRKFIKHIYETLRQHELSL